MRAPEQWPVETFRSWVEHLSDQYRQGAVNADRRDTYIDPPTSLLGFAALTLRKFGHFWAVWLAGYSWVHRVANVVFFLPAYSLAALAMLRACRPDADSTRSKVVLGLTLLIALPTLFHSLQDIDFDHRYRLPALVPLVQMASLGWSEVLGMARRLVTAQTGR
jgi:hypothetical protein